MTGKYHSSYKHRPRSIPTQSRRKSRHDCPKEFYDAARTEVGAMISESAGGWHICYKSSSIRQPVNMWDTNMHTGKEKIKLIILQVLTLS